MIQLRSRPPTFESERLSRDEAKMRSKLFVPGSRPELFDKAYLSAADAISFDLEDAVAADRKDEARRLVAGELARRRGEGLKISIVRVNGLEGELFAADLDAIVQDGLDVLNLPKIERPDEIRHVAKLLDRLEAERGVKRPIGILANIETPRGVRLAAEIASAHMRVVGLQLGFGDLFEPFGISRSEPMALNAIRLAIRLAAAEAGLPAYDGAFVGVTDIAGFRAEAELARQFGLAGKSCVHPTQVEIANEVFFPRASEIAAARKVVVAADEMLSRGVGAFTVDGAMVDGPFIARARAIVALADGSEHGA
jgi:citrate lyase subunit beta/citryl-CoA lyase